MAEFVERDEIAARDVVAADGDRFAVARLGLFFELVDHGAGGAVLHRFGQLAQPMDGVFKQLGHARSITWRPGAPEIDNSPKSIRKKNVVRSEKYRSTEPRKGDPAFLGSVEPFFGVFDLPNSQIRQIDLCRNQIFAKCEMAKSQKLDFGKSLVRSIAHDRARLLPAIESTGRGSMDALS
jgi:hypothetical protein